MCVCVGLSEAAKPVHSFFSAWKTPNPKLPSVDAVGMVEPASSESAPETVDVCTASSPVVTAASSETRVLDTSAIVAGTPSVAGPVKPTAVIFLSKEQKIQRAAEEKRLQVTQRPLELRFKSCSELVSVRVGVVLYSRSALIS